ncbi:ectoine/hydroxyectoine ABC transporter substrate-binding protein EhuB [Bradyrhizobium sp. NBAIM01]|uniref:ectoine/hydroxyectoine ABC transporter substrate-binding protein EhuB n=1 Tax=Bradyrhizobium sp. NBAIM01 TaxID=2793818 RepID=UPI001CD2D79F|nr:ectoine/hydroxyectoine ABC transporter substrate-binding protein EhuB [Bradyrhizobium sp. NBAIM01]MCA1510401.1 ectoine/hydroxyectoine ABC transporter substrate-binding protein EhuB [Bradyrhizobium sp. NBAIM01]
MCLFIRVATLTVAATLAFAAMAHADDSLERAQKGGVTFGFSNEPPYAYLSPEGKPAGTSAEIVVAIFKRMGITEVRPVLTEWASLIPGLKARRFDVVVPMFILPNRCREVAFSNPISQTGAAMLVKKGNPKQIQSYEDAAKNKDVIVAVMSGAAEQGFARKAGIPDDRIMPLQDPGALLSAVKSGRADAAAVSPGSAKSMAEKGGGDVEAAQLFHSAPRAISYSAPPFRKEDESLLKAFNKALSEYVGSAEHKAINATIGRGDEVLPGNVTSEELCKRD